MCGRRPPRREAGCAVPRDQGAWRRQAVRNEALFRETNSRLAELYVESDEHGECEFLCECSDSSCTDAIALTIDEYAVVRAHPARFAVVPGHELPAIERLVAAGKRFAVVQKSEVP